MVTGIHCLCSFNGRVEHVPIYKRGHYYGLIDYEKYTSVEHCVSDLVKTGFAADKGATSVTLTNQLSPDK